MPESRAKKASMLTEELRRTIKRRIASGEVSMTSLSRRAAVNPSQLSEFVEGRRTFHFKVLDRLLHALGISELDLLTSVVPIALDSKMDLVIFRQLPPRKKSSH
jgi:transcriptional regulator with XRE-family HTH domain